MKAHAVRAPPVRSLERRSRTVQASARLGSLATGDPPGPYNRSVKKARKARTSKRAARRLAPVAPSPVAILDERGLPLVSELARVARSAEPPARKLEGALEILFGAYGESDREFSALLLNGWVRARDDKQFRLTLAWQREQLRLSIEEILAEGLARGAFRRGIDPGAVAAVILGAAEGCLLQAATEGGAVSPAELVRCLLGLMLNGA